MTKRNIRTPEQIIADTEAKLAKLRERQMKQEAANDPDLLPLLAEKESIHKEASKARTLLGDGPQSGNARIAKHEAWIAKIERQNEEAWNTLGVADQALAEVNSRIQKMIESKAQNASN